MSAIEQANAAAHRLARAYLDERDAKERLRSTEDWSEAETNASLALFDAEDRTLEVASEYEQAMRRVVSENTPEASSGPEIAPDPAQIMGEK